MWWLCSGQHRVKVKVVFKDEDFHGYAHTQSSFLTLNSTQTRLLHIDKYMRVCVWNRLVRKDWGGPGISQAHVTLFYSKASTV